MSNWPLTYNYNNPLPSEQPEDFNHLSDDQLWNALISHLEVFITYHIYISTTLHFLTLMSHLFKGTLRERGDISFKDAATLKWVENQGIHNGGNWASLTTWENIIHEEQRCYEMVKHIQTYIKLKI